MRRIILAATMAATVSLGLTAPLAAQSATDQQRFDAAADRFNRELATFQSESDRYMAARQADRRYDRRGQGGPGYGGQGAYYSDDRYENGYDPARYYRNGPNYQERTLAADDRVYRGTDGRYYCKRNDGTTGLVVGAAAGGIFGNVIDGGHSRAAGTLIGAAVGALAGRAVDQNSTSQNNIRCR